MDQEVLVRLRRLGVVKGTRQLRSSQTSSRRAKPASTVFERGETGAPGEPVAIEQLLPGLSLTETADGSCLVLDKVYPLAHVHGLNRLGELLQFETDHAATFCGDRRLAGVSYRDFLFIDTETTGLRGAGTIAFLVGVAFFEGDALVVRQYFLRDHGDEPAMLTLLSDLLEESDGLITFNGVSFDLPLLDSRFLLNGLPSVLLERPHIDLLPPARRLWRLRFASCALGSLEENVLGLQRSEEDVPGWLIPSLYHDYLRTGDARPLTRVFYHNRIDMLSMVTLAARIVRQFSRPEPNDHPIDLLGLGRWLADLGLVAEAEETLRQAAVPEMPTELFQQALRNLGFLLKRDGRRRAASQVWQQLASVTFDDVTGHVELAKHYEWHEIDLESAHKWTRRALDLLKIDGSRDERAALEHRMARLERKLGQQDDGHVGSSGKPLG